MDALARKPSKAFLAMRSRIFGTSSVLQQQSVAILTFVLPIINSSAICGSVHSIADTSFRHFIRRELALM
jgi:hypothetical protein